MRDDDQLGEGERGPEDVFCSLRGREVPELDSHGLWQRVRPARAAWWQRLAPSPAARLAWAAGLTAVAALALWQAQPAPMMDVDAPPVEAPLVLLADEPVAPMPAPAEAPPPLATLDLDVRLVRAYSGALPADAFPESTSGAGAARLLGDIDPTLRALVPDRDFAVVGAWDGELAEGAVDAALSADLHMAFEARRDGGAVRLAGVRLQGADIAGQTGELVMQPGRVYVLGVEVAGQTEPLLLALRLRERSQ